MPNLSPATPTTRSSTTSTNMTSEITNVLQMVRWGTRLSLSLYDFAANVPAATKDVNRLAKEINLLSLVLRQVGSTLKEDGTIPSDEAAQCLKEILDQCRLIFWEIETLVPVKGIRDEKGAPTGLGIQHARWNWSDVSMAKGRYLLAMLEALKMVMSVMLQTIYLAKIVIWSRHQRSQLAFEAVDIERLQFHSLVIEQQLSLIRMTKLYREFQLCKSVASPPPHQLNMPALVQSEDHCPPPYALNQYQEASLAEQPLSRYEAEDLVRVQGISSQFCGILLQRWTKLDDIECRLAELEDAGRRRLLLTAPMDVRRRSQQPTVESESEEDDDVPRLRIPKPRSNTPGPILMRMDEIDKHRVSSPRTMSSPVNIPNAPSPASLRPPGQSPRSYSAGSPINSFFPASPTNSRPISRPSPGPSPLSSPRNSVSAMPMTAEQEVTSPPSNVLKTNTSPTTPYTEAPPVQHPQSPPPKAPGIPWRLRRRDVYWDHIDGTCVDANTSKPPPEATILDRNTVTEIFDRWVRRQALDEAGLEYMPVNKEVSDSRRTKFEICWVIQRTLSYPEVRQLHRRTLELDRIDREKEQAKAERKRRGPLHPPPLDRRQTAPAPLQIPRSPATNNNNNNSPQHLSPLMASHHRTGSMSSYKSYHSPRSSQSFSSRENTESDTESDATRRRRVRSRSRRPERSKSRGAEQSKSRGPERSKSGGPERSKSRSRSYSIKDDERSSRKRTSKKDALAKAGLAGVGVSALLEGLL